MSREASWSCFGLVLGWLEPILGLSLVVLGYLGSLLGLSWAVLGLSWDVLDYRRLGGESNWEIVSFRSCVRAHGSDVGSNSLKIAGLRLSLLPFVA